MSQPQEVPFSLLSPDLLAQAQVIRKAPGEYVTQAGIPVEHFYLMRSGLAKLIYDPSDGDPLILDLYHEGDFFGEMEMVGVGYSDRKHFTALFHKMAGLNPAEYRKLYG